MLKGYKTLLVALALVVFGALETFDFTQFLDAGNAGLVTTIIGLIVGFLRYLTTTPIAKSE